ncbi:ATP-binding protein [Neobacillus novalis]|uniref:histidine kinase n=1 Tax=Neobacillus novalis TaxID=220687 RepID=A0AA95MPH6_9BACI|nr:ATP-binding protein [Neobacillus novalis]WHY87874.1 ATP-binding protein [Neobacillus novalis]
MEKQIKQESALPLENSEMQKVEFDLQKSEQRYRRIFEDSIDGLILWDNQHRIVDINLAGEKMLCLPKERLIGFRLYDLYTHHESNTQEIIQHIEQVLNNGHCTPITIVETVDGKKKYFEYSSKAEIVEGLNFTVFKDISEMMEMQEHLRKSDTLNVIGELAAGIAHEIRNPMTALKGFIQLLEGSIMKEHSMYYQVITSELQRIDSIINEFLILAKPQATRYEEKEITQIMKETVDLLTAQAVLHNVQFVTNYNEQLPPIFCEPNQLKKVFINLIKNAIEVMQEGGNITITIKKIANRMSISIEDEGIGIPKEIINKLGEPFYTTKDQGTGLGLMVSFRIIAEHKGTINVESEEGKGTIFRITLPIEDNNVAIPK